MRLPKIQKQTELRDDLYKTLEEVAGGITLLVPTKNGDIVLLSREEYDSLVFEKELLQEFETPVSFEELIDSEKIFKELDKKYGFK